MPTTQLLTKLTAHGAFHQTGPAVLPFLLTQISAWARSESGLASASRVLDHGLQWLVITPSDQACTLLSTASGEAAAPCGAASDDPGHGVVSIDLLLQHHKRRHRLGKGAHR